MGREKQVLCLVVSCTDPWLQCGDEWLGLSHQEECERVYLPGARVSSLYLFWISAKSGILECLGNNNDNGIKILIF